jgi:hypothetical protein
VNFCTNTRLTSQKKVLFSIRFLASGQLEDEGDLEGEYESNSLVRMELVEIRVLVVAALNLWFTLPESGLISLSDFKYDEL